MTDFINSSKIPFGYSVESQTPIDDKNHYASLADFLSDKNDTSNPLSWYRGMGVKFRDTLVVSSWINTSEIPNTHEVISGTEYVYDDNHPDANYAGLTYALVTEKAPAAPITAHSGLNLDDGTNPHGTTKDDVGLGNVPNTDFTQSVADNTSHRTSTSGNPHDVTKGDVGLPDVPNTDFTQPVADNAAAAAAADAKAVQAQSTANQALSDISNVDLKADSKLFLDESYETGDSVEQNTLVISNGWLSASLEATSEPAAPQNEGPQEESIVPGSVWEADSNTSVVKSVTRHVIKQTGWIKSLSLLTPFADSDTIFKVVWKNLSTGRIVTEDNLLLTANVYNTISAANAIVTEGDIIEVEFSTYNSAKANRITGGWDSTIATGEPLSQEFNIDNASNPTVIEISHTDLDSVNRATELDGVAIDSIISISETGDTNRSIEVKVTAIDTVAVSSTKYTVELISTGGNTIRDGRTCTINIDIPITQPTDFSLIQNHYTTQPAFADITTSLFFDGVDQAAPITYAYGVNLVFQKAYVSTKWKLLSDSPYGGEASAPSEANVTGVSTINTLQVLSLIGMPGWGTYSDNETSPATQVFTTTPQVLSIDGEGSLSNSSSLPLAIRGSGELWDSVNNKITPIAVGDSYDFRIDLGITAKSGSPTLLDFVMDIGGTSGITIPIIQSVLIIPKTPPFTFSFGLSFYSLSTFLSNGGKLFLSTDTGSVTISSRRILITRTSTNLS